MDEKDSTSETSKTLYLGRYRMHWIETKSSPSILNVLGETYPNSKKMVIVTTGTNMCGTLISKMRNSMKPDLRVIHPSFLLFF